MIKITQHIYNLISPNPKLLNLIQTVLFSSNINKIAPLKNNNQAYNQPNTKNKEQNNVRSNRHYILYKNGGICTNLLTKMVKK
jgi:hypothetical protein